MAKEVWEIISKTEAEARRLTETAKLQKTELIKKAKEEATQILKTAEAEATAAGVKNLDDKNRQLQQWTEEYRGRVDAEIAGLTAMGEKRLPEAVNLIIKKVVS